MATTSIVTSGFAASGNAMQVSYGVPVVGDVVIIDANLFEKESLDCEVSWTSGNLNAIFIYTPFAAILRFNHNTTPQNFETIAGGVFHWDNSGGIPCPCTGTISNLRILRLDPEENPTDGTEDANDIVQIRYNKDATP